MNKCRWCGGGSISPEHEQNCVMRDPGNTHTGLDRRIAGRAVDTTPRHLTIIAKAIDHARHRYPTYGDYQTNPDGLVHVYVSASPKWEWELCCIVHELVECYLCYQAGVSEYDVDEFDKLFEQERREGKHDIHAEPGDDPRAPYRAQHAKADAIERVLAIFLGVDWAEYTAWVEKLP